MTSAPPSLEAIEDTLVDFASRTMAVDPATIDKNTSLMDQGMDSMGTAEFTFEIEEAYGFKTDDIPEEDFHSYMVISTLAARLQSALTAS